MIRTYSILQSFRSIRQALQKDSSCSELLLTLEEIEEYVETLEDLLDDCTAGDWDDFGF